MLNEAMLSVITLNVIMLSVVMLIVVVPFKLENLFKITFLKNS
jgi:hypothetical protein